MTITLLGAILERARKSGLIEHNHARDKDLRAKEREPARSYLKSADQIAALIDAAGEQDAEARGDRKHIERRAMLAVLTFAGLRIGELVELRWRNLDLAGGWLKVGAAKTDAGVREVRIRGVLRDELAAVRGCHQDAPQSAYVFATRQGGQLSPNNIRNRVLAVAVKRASEQLEAAGQPPLPDKLTPHSLRRTFASVLVALGEDPGTIMDEMGHTDASFTLRVYRQSMRRGEDEKKALWTLVEGGVMADGGRRGQDHAAAAGAAEAENPINSAVQGA